MSAAFDGGTRARVTVYALHALGGSGRSFRALAALLAPRVRLVPNDRPGLGDALEVSGYRVAQMADHVIARIHRDGASRWILLGHSMGGKVVSLVARRALQGADPVFGLAGVVLLAGSPPTPEPMPDDKRQEMLGWVTGGSISSGAARTFVDDNTASPLPDDVDRAATEDLLRMEPAAWRAWLTDGSREDVSGEVGELDLPSVVIAGEDDADLGADAQPSLHGGTYPRARFVRLAATGHFVPQERPADVAREIEALCDEIDAHSPVVPDDWAGLLRAPVDQRVRATLAVRALADDPAYVPRALTPGQLETLRAVAAIVVPQPEGGRIDLAARLDRQLAKGEGDGWRPADLPPDAVTTALALDAIAHDFHADPPGAIEGLLAGELAPSASALSADQLRSWFEDARVDLVRQWLAHPASLARAGYDTFATRGGAEPRGFLELAAGRREAWEPRDVGTRTPMRGDAA